MSCRSLWLLSGLMWLSGCSLLGPPITGGEEAGPDATAVALPRGDAVTVHRYALSSPGQSVVGDTQVIIARDEDTFSDIARSYGLGYDELRNANPDVDPWLPGEGTEILLPTRFVLPDAPQEGIVLNIAAKRLYWYPSAGDDEVREVITYPIGIGRVGWATPVGESKVIAKAKDPAWYVPASVRAEHREAGDPLPAVVPPGPDNPLGRHVLKLDMPGYLLHGTNQPYGVGMRVSHGCVRLYPEDIEALFAVAGIGTPVRIINEPIVAGWRDKRLFVVAYPALEDDSRDADTRFEDALDRIRDRHWMLRDAEGAAWLAAVTAVSDGVAYAADREQLDAGARLVDNLTSEPDDAPSRSEVTEMMEAMMEEAASSGG